ncbi:MAG: GMC family oxidoreductase N-terminal domain-containing protein [Actinomycetota bacterium]
MNARLGDRRVLGVLAALARGILGEGYVPEVPERMLDAIGEVANRGERAQFLAMLKALDTRVGALLLTGKPVPVSWLSPAGAERLIQKWKSDRLAMRRRLADAFASMALSSLYARPSPEWQRIGYPGPLGAAPDEPKRLSPMEIAEDTVLDCDVVIVGSGAGGGCVAGNLAAAGADVVVVEKGGYHSESDFNHVEADATREMYLYGMTLATADRSVRIIAGSTLGGGTVVNYATAFRPPDFVLEEWAHQSRIDAFVSGEFEESLDEVGARLGVNTDSSAAGRRDEVMEEGLKKLGWHVDMMPRAVRGCSQDEHCGYCGFGCRIGAKQSTMRTYLEDASANGARLITGADARTVRIGDGGRAVGVEAVCGPHRLTVNARAVVAAAGAIETPALLLRTGLREGIGRDLHLHPGCAATAIFDDDVRMWEGTTQARYSAEFRSWDGGYGPIFETVPIHPGSGSVGLPWVSTRDHREKMEQFRKVSFCAVLPRDKTAGRITLNRDGSPRIDYVLSKDDARRIGDGVIAAGKVMEAAGANEIFSPHATPISYRPGTADDHGKWAEETTLAGYEKGKVTYFSFHQMGSCRMGVDPTKSAIGPDNETHEIEHLYVTDASAFPTASGVNPMLTIYGIANRAAKIIARRLA